MSNSKIIIIFSSITLIDAHAFSGCKKIKEIYFYKGNSIGVYYLKFVGSTAGTYNQKISTPYTSLSTFKTAFELDGRTVSSSVFTGAEI